MVAESGRNLEDKSLSIGKSFKYSIPSRVIFQPRTRLPIYKKWTMGPIYLQVKSLQLDHFRSKSTPISFGFATFLYPSSSMSGCEGPAWVRLGGGSAKYI